MTASTLEKKPASRASGAAFILKKAAISALVSVGILGVGYAVFKRLEWKLADLL